MKQAGKQPNESCNTRNGKLERRKALELHEQGLSITDIAQHQGVARSTVWRFLQQTEPERRALEHFKTHRGEVLARLQAKSIDTQERILDTLKDEVIEGLTPSQKSGLIMALNAQTGTAFDKERLERGQSTENLSVLSRMMDSRISQLHKPKPGEEAGPAGSAVDDQTQAQDGHASDGELIGPA